MATATSEPPMVEQVITEFFAKSLHIILESRSPYESSRNFTRPSPPSSPLAGSQPRDRWFNLALRDCPAALENFDLWRQSNLEPLVIDIVLLHRNNTSTTGAGAGKIIERWVIQYETRKSGSGNSNVCKNNGRKSRNSSAVDHSLYRSTYQGSTVLLRSLYLVVRLLPAYNIFRELNSSGRIRPLNLSHKISSFVKPFTRAEDAEMKHYAFSPIETMFGRLSLSVSYVPVLEVVATLEPTTPMPVELIMDYIGSPTTDFLKKFNALPSAGIAPACVAMTRRHSWSIEHGPGPAVSPSPSPMNSEPRGRLQPRILTHDNSLTTCSHPQSTYKALQKVLSFGKDDLGYFRGLKLPRTSSKPFIMDELDDQELAFAWEDRDTIIDQLNRADIWDREDQGTNQDAGGSLTRTPAASVGALVLMLKTAPGLRESLPSIAAPLVPQEPSSVQRVVTEEHGNVALSSAVVPSALLRSRTAADVPEELKKYREIRESILNRRKTQPRDTKLGDKPTDGDP